MTKAELIAEISARTKLPADKAEAFVDAFSEEIIDGLMFDSFVFLNGLGIFWPKREEERQARNPKTDEAFKIKAKSRPTFTPGTLTEHAKSAGYPILTIQELSENLARKYAFDQSKSLDAINAYIEIVIEALNRGEKIVVLGLGTFDSSRYPKRSLKDPDTGEVFSTEERRIYGFRPAKVFMERLMMV